jgi:O-methyltransferase involved in polyketide biosynthesis
MRGSVFTFALCRYLGAEQIGRIISDILTRLAHGSRAATRHGFPPFTSAMYVFARLGRAPNSRHQ